MPKAETKLSYDTTSDGLIFGTPPLDEATRNHRPGRGQAVGVVGDHRRRSISGAAAVRPAGKEVTFIGSNDPRVPVGLGWLRASHRKLDPKKSLPYRPWHSHDEIQPLKPGEPVELDIEIWPT